MTDITPQHEVKMRVACQALVGLHTDRTDPLESFGSRVMVRQYLDIVRPELVIGLLDMGNQITDAMERIDQMVKAAGFDNLENALKAIERIGKALHGVEHE